MANKSLYLLYYKNNILIANNYNKPTLQALQRSRQSIISHFTCCIAIVPASFTKIKTVKISNNFVKFPIHSMRTQSTITPSIKARKMEIVCFRGFSTTLDAF